ncbi:MAG: hypothetical protein RLY50_994 [Actinomycetota bacterium]
MPDGQRATFAVGEIASPALVFDEALRSPVGGESVVDLPPAGGVVAAVVENDRAHSVWALQVGEEQRTIVFHGIGESLDGSNFEHGGSDPCSLVGTVVDDEGHHPQTPEEQGEERDSPENRCHGAGKGGSQAGGSHAPIVAGWFLCRVTA